MKKQERTEVIENLTARGSTMSKEREDSIMERIDEYMATDIPEDAGLAIIKAKHGEIANKQRHVYKRYAVKKKELCNLERLVMPVEMHYKEQVEENNRNLPSKERLDKDAKAAKVKKLVNTCTEKGTDGIYDRIINTKSDIELLEGVLRNNKMIADRAENMLNAQINLDRQIQVAARPGGST